MIEKFTIGETLLAQDGILTFHSCMNNSNCNKVCFWIGFFFFCCSMLKASLWFGIKNRNLSTVFLLFVYWCLLCMFCFISLMDTSYQWGVCSSVLIKVMVYLFLRYPLLSVQYHCLNFRPVCVQMVTGIWIKHIWYFIHMKQSIYSLIFRFINAFLY